MSFVEALAKLPESERVENLQSTCRRHGCRLPSAVRAGQRLVWSSPVVSLLAPPDVAHRSFVIGQGSDWGSCPLSLESAANCWTSFCPWYNTYIFLLGQQSTIKKYPSETLNLSKLCKKDCFPFSSPINPIFTGEGKNLHHFNKSHENSHRYTFRLLFVTLPHKKQRIYEALTLALLIS